MSYEERNGALHEPPFHGWFGLSYSHYIVMPRSLLQAMPHGWQERMIALIDEFREVFDHNADYLVRQRGEDGKFIHDPCANYRYPERDKFPWAVKEEPMQSRNVT